MAKPKPAAIPTGCPMAAERDTVIERLAGEERSTETETVKTRIREATPILDKAIALAHPPRIRTWLEDVRMILEGWEDDDVAARDRKESDG